MIQTVSIVPIISVATEEAKPSNITTESLEAQKLCCGKHHKREQLLAVYGGPEKGR